MLIASFISDLVNAVETGINWAIQVAIFATAAMLAISLLAWLVHRSS